MRFGCLSKWEVAEYLFILANQFQKYDVTQVQDSRDSATNVLSHKSDPWTVGTCITRAGILLLINQPNFPPRVFELMVTALAVTERQNTPKTTFFTAVSRPFYNVQWDRFYGLEEFSENYIHELIRVVGRK